MELLNTTLGDLPEGVARPTYDRTALTPGIVHIGLGNFHRAHQAWYTHRLMMMGLARDWAILGAGVRPYDQAMRARLKAQDCLTTLISLAPEGRSAEVTGAMVDYIEIAEGCGPLIAAMTDPHIRIVALTVTEGGYYTTTAGGFDADHADITHDATHPGTPRTAFGAIVAALRARRGAGAGPFTLQSCDNLQGNGAILRQTVTGLARLSDPDLADWIETHCSFPNSMVDCIVPATGPQEIEIARALGIDDAAPVTHENFRQWVIEDDFCAGRPAWERVGATFTDDVHAYETMKIRILNAGHQVLANVGEILSLPTIAACMSDADVRAFLAKVEAEEIVPYVQPVPGMTPEAYLQLITQRFSNPMIQDTTRRVAFDGSSRHSGFVLPILRDALAAGGSVQGLALVEALWARMCLGTRDDGTRIEANDPFWPELTQAAQQAQSSPEAWLAQSRIYGDLATTKGFAGDFAPAFGHWLRMLGEEGTRATLEAYLRG